MSSSGSRRKFSFDPRAWKWGLPLFISALMAFLFSAFWGGIMTVLAILHVVFFREPGYTQALTADVLSPGSGHISDITEIQEDRFLEGTAVRIGIFLSIFDVHIQRSPLSGQVAYLNYSRGKFLNALKPESARVNESNDIGLICDGKKILVRQIAGAIARKIYWDIQIGDSVGQGDKLGVICYGSRVECFVPAENFKTSVKIGDAVHCGKSVLGFWS